MVRVLDLGSTSFYTHHWIKGNRDAGAHPHERGWFPDPSKPAGDLQFSTLEAASPYSRRASWT